MSLFPLQPRLVSLLMLVLLSAPLVFVVGCPVPFTSTEGDVGRPLNALPHLPNGAGGLAPGQEFPSDVGWVLEFASPQRFQVALAAVIERADAPTRLFEGIDARFSSMIGVSPTSSLVWRGAGVNKSKAIRIASRARVGGGNDLLLSAGVTSRDRFVDAVSGLIGKDATQGPKVGDVVTIVDGGRTAALVRFVDGRAVTWFEPGDPLASAALLMQPRRVRTHPLFTTSVDEVVESARNARRLRGEEIAILRAGPHAALAWQDSLLTLLAPELFSAAGGVVHVSKAGDLTFDAAFSYREEDRAAVSSRLTTTPAPKEACALDDDAALFATFPVDIGLASARKEGAPLPAPDRLDGSAALAFYPHRNRNAVPAGESPLEMGGWTFVARPRDENAVAALHASLDAGGMTETEIVGGAKVRTTTPPSGNVSKKFDAALSSQAMLVALGRPLAFERALTTRNAGTLDDNCARVFAPLSLSLDGDALARAAAIGNDSAFVRLAARVSATLRAASVRVEPTPVGFMVDLSLTLRAPSSTTLQK